MSNCSGFSPRNLKYIRRYAELWPTLELVQQPLHKLPWFHLSASRPIRRDHHTSPTPTASSGSDSSWPMVSQPKAM